MSKKIFASALLLALARGATQDDDEMAKIAFSVANILNHHDAKPAATPITQQPAAQPAATKKITQDDFDKLVDELSKKVPTQAAKPVENKPMPSKIENVVQADIDRIVAQINEKKAHTETRENQVIIPKKDETKQAHFDSLFEELRNKLKAAHEGEHKSTPTVNVADKYDQIVAKIMKEKTAAPKATVTVQPAAHKTLSPYEIEREQNYHELLEKLTKAHAGHTTEAPKVVVPVKPVEKKAEEKTTVSCLLAHAEATSTIRKIADAAEKTFTVTSTVEIRHLLDELSTKVAKINEKCEAEYRVELTHTDVSTTCQRDFAMAGSLAKIFKNTHPGSIQRVMATSKMMMAVRENMTKNC